MSWFNTNIILCEARNPFKMPVRGKEWLGAKGGEVEDAGHAAGVADRQAERVNGGGESEASAAMDIAD